MAFFGTTCSEPPRTDKEFGLCDPGNNQPAYSDAANQPTWLATVVNADGGQVVFTAIDYCLIFLQRGTSNKESTCDGMLEKGATLCLVELKDRDGRGWLGKGRNQLENTIRLLKQHENLSRFKDKRAYVCNKQRPGVTVLSTTDNLMFLRTHDFRLVIDPTVVL